MRGLDYAGVRGGQQAQLENSFGKLDIMMKSEDIREGLTAFMEKRKPVWKGH